MLDEANASPSGVKREGAVSAIPDSEKNLVGKWQREIRADKYYFDKVFRKMRTNMEYARLGASKDWAASGNYTVPIINRFINQAVAGLYAKNPRAQAKRKQKLLYSNWDGTQETAQAALQLTQTPGVDPVSVQQAQLVIQDVQNSKNYDQLMTRTGRTLEILWEYYTGEDFPDFKKRMKANVRRAKTTGIGYVEVSFHRAVEPDPDVVARIGDCEQELALIRSRQADLQDGEYDETDVRALELQSMLQTLEQQKLKIITEGLTFDFPRATDIIPHRNCTDLSGFIDCDYITREYLKTPEEIQSLFQIDVGSQYKVYSEDGAAKNGGDADTTGNVQEGDRGDNSDDYAVESRKIGDKQQNGKACLWKVMNKKTQQVFWICEGYPGWVKAPQAPDNQVHGFWWLFPLTFNSVEDEKEVFPPSDVEYLLHPQREYNNARQGVREHRVAARPKYFTKKGAMEEEDKAKIATAPAHAVIELAGIEGAMTIDQLIMPFKGIAIDPNLYATGDILKDIEVGVGAQSADLGPTNESTATQSSISEQSRMSTLASNVDDLDEFLSEVARCASQIMMQQMNKDSVIEIVGPGAVWPEMDASSIMKELLLEIRAGSAGRPNQAAELANLERAMQFLIQLGGINPKALAKKYCDLLNLDEEEFILDGMPSILSLNAMAAQHAQAVAQIAQQNAGAAVNNMHPQQPPAAHNGGQPAPSPPGQPQMPHANPSLNPGSQGPAGMHNAPASPGIAPGAQPAYPAPVAHVMVHNARPV